MCYAKHMKRTSLWLFLPLLAALVAFSAWPALDLAASGLFYNSAKGGFWLAHARLPLLIHDLCNIGTRVLVALLAIAALVAWRRKRPVLGLNIQAALFLLTVLIVGPGLITNSVLKDNWGRARPHQVQQFGGKAHFSPALRMTDQCDDNCSFIAGDPSLGFALHAPFYLVAPARRRRVFWGGFAGGGLLFGIDRLIMGGHFASDILWAGLVMLATTALVHICFYGRRATCAAWRDL